MIKSPPRAVEPSRIGDTSERHIGVLDGMRGLSALWVLIGHAMGLTHFFIPVLRAPEVAVDVFMVISGFLMTYHYAAPAKIGKVNLPNTWGTFWVRRFFRIAPLYYVVLGLSLLFQPAIAAAHRVIAESQQIITPPGNFADRGLDNILAHVTFVFGNLHHYYWRGAVPDWSLGLEMQFYLVFPFLVIAAVRFGWMRTALVTSALCAVATFAFPGYFRPFELPSTLPLKLNVFFGGMLLATVARQREASWVRVAVACLLIEFPLAQLMGNRNVLIKDEVIRIAAMLICVPLLLQAHLGNRLRSLLGPVTALMSGRVAKFLADTSYCVYLIHLVILNLVVGAGLYRIPSAPLRCASAIAVTALISYGLAWLGHRAVEQPGIELGRWLSARGAQSPPSKKAMAASA